MTVARPVEEREHDARLERACAGRARVDPRGEPLRVERAASDEERAGAGVLLRQRRHRGVALAVMRRRRLDGQEARRVVERRLGLHEAELLEEASAEVTRDALVEPRRLRGRRALARREAQLAAEPRVHEVLREVDAHRGRPRLVGAEVHEDAARARQHRVRAGRARRAHEEEPEGLVSATVPPLSQRRADLRDLGGRGARIERRVAEPRGVIGVHRVRERRHAERAGEIRRPDEGPPLRFTHAGGSQAEARRRVGGADGRSVDRHRELGLLVLEARRQQHEGLAEPAKSIVRDDQRGRHRARIGRRFHVVGDRELARWDARERHGDTAPHVGDRRGDRAGAIARRERRDVGGRTGREPQRGRELPGGAELDVDVRGGGRLGAHRDGHVRPGARRRRTGGRRR